jgi:hypothetical protein
MTQVAIQEIKHNYQKIKLLQYNLVILQAIVSPALLNALTNELDKLSSNTDVALIVLKSEGTGHFALASFDELFSCF